MLLNPEGDYLLWWKSTSTKIYVLPFPFFNFGKLIVIEIILRIHLYHLCFCRSPHHFYYLDQVINTTLSYKERSTVKHLKNYTSQRPNVNHGRVVCGSKDKFRSTIAPGTNIRQVRFVGKYFRWPKITYNELVLIE